MGLQHADSKLRSGYVEGYGTSADMNRPRGCDHLLHLPLKFISNLTCDEAWGVCESLVWELWGNAPIYGQGRLGEMDCVTTSQLSEQRAFTAVLRVSDSPLRSLLWLHVVSVVSNKEEILVPSWPAHRGHREIYGVCLLYRGCFWTEPDINNTSPCTRALLAPLSCSGQVTLLNARCDYMVLFFTWYSENKNASRHEFTFVWHVLSWRYITLVFKNVPNVDFNSKLMGKSLGKVLFYLLLPPVGCIFKGLFVISQKCCPGKGNFYCKSNTSTGSALLPHWNIC